MKQMNFRMRVQAWKDIDIQIKDENIFNERIKDIFEEEGRTISFHDLEDIFDDCVIVEHSDFDWEEEDTEDFYELIENYMLNFNLIQNS
jgi:hypothetical protein